LLSELIFQDEYQIPKLKFSFGVIPVSPVKVKKLLEVARFTVLSLVFVMRFLMIFPPFLHLCTNSLIEMDLLIGLVFV
jgi:hypothetical protein